MKAFSLSPGWLRTLLLFSLCFNALFGAFFVTRWSGWPRAPIYTAPPARLVELVARRLPAADAAILRQTYRERAGQFAAVQREYVQELRAAGQLLAQTPLDSEALRAAVARVRDKRIMIGDLAIETFLEAAPRMSAEGRRGLNAGIRAR